MAKRAAKTTSVRKLHRAATVLDLIESMLARHPNEIETLKSAVASARHLIGLEIKLEEKRKRLSRLRELVDKASMLKAHLALMYSNAEEEQSLLEELRQAKLELRKAKQESRRSKRMSEARIETAKAYLAQQEKHSSQRTTLLALVKLPSEQNKTYAVQYRKSDNAEDLRQHVKSLMRVYKKHLEKETAVRDSEAEIERIEDLIAGLSAISQRKRSTSD